MRVGRRAEMIVLSDEERRGRGVRERIRERKRDRGQRDRGEGTRGSCLWRECLRGSLAVLEKECGWKDWKDNGRRVRGDSDSDSER